MRNEMRARNDGKRRRNNEISNSFIIKDVKNARAHHIQNANQIVV